MRTGTQNGVDSVQSELAAARGWQVFRETVHIRNQEEADRTEEFILSVVVMECIVSIVSGREALERRDSCCPSVVLPAVYITLLILKHV